MKRVVVVGGGVAGLAAALGIRDRAQARGVPIEVRVVEANARAGGNLRTERDDGFTIERGPNGFLDNVPATLDLVRRIGLEGELQPADALAARRFLFRHGRLHELRASPLGFLASPVLSWRGRARVLGEPWTRPRAGSRAGLDESVHAFAARHLGEEAAHVLVGAMVAGVFAGDSRQLSLASAFPKMAAMEEGHGSLVRAMLAKARERRAAKRRLVELRARGEDAPELERPGGPAGPGGTLTSFRGGIETLVDALVRALPGAVETGRAADWLGRHPVAGGGSPWRVMLRDGGELDADAVVVAIPAGPAAPLLGPLDRELGDAVAAIPSAGLAVIALGFDAAAFDERGGAPRGFGFLAPRGEGLRILGCLWDSSIFPGRAPAGKVLVRAMIGGALDPEALHLSDGELVHAVREDLRRAMGLHVEPERVWVYRHALGISQYTVGHGARLAAIERALERLPGLYVAGQSYYGIAMNAAIESAGRIAERVVDGLAVRAAA